MPKRSRRILAAKNKINNVPIENKMKDEEMKVAERENTREETTEYDMSTARGRFKGVLMEALEGGDDSDEAPDYPSSKNERTSQDNRTDVSEDEAQTREPSPVRQSYVLKLFDRSVDLSQFQEDSPLYPICRAWIANQPKANYSKRSNNTYKEPEPTEDSVTLPGPEGPPVSRIPELLPEQEARSKDNINLDYSEAAPPSRHRLLSAHLARWAGVRRAWLRRAAAAEQRYAATQRLLDTINAKPKKGGGSMFGCIATDHKHLYFIMVYTNFLEFKS